MRVLEYLDKVIEIDQSPIGRTPRSNPATYTKTFDIIRELYAETTMAKMRGYKKGGDLALILRAGAARPAKVMGSLRLRCIFLPDVFVPCEVCNGRRYNREALQVLYRDKSIADVLEMTVEEALEFLC